MATIAIAPSVDPRLDPNDPRNDPNDPRYRRYPPVGDPRTDPRTGDPNDPRYGRYPGPYRRPGVDIILTPGGREQAGDLSQHEKALVQKDFADKSHSLEPVAALSGRDKFLFFAVGENPANVKGFTLRLPPSIGMPQEIVLKF